MVRRFSLAGQFPARALSGPVAPRGSESGEMSSECAVARPELGIAHVHSLINTRRQGRIYFLEPRFGTVKITSPVSRRTVKWLQVAEDSFQVNHCWVTLFLRFPSADLKIGAIARIVVGCYRIRHNQSVARARPAAGWYGAGRRWVRPVQRGRLGGLLSRSAQT